MRICELPDVDSLKLKAAGLRFDPELGVSFDVNPHIAPRAVAKAADLAVQALRKP